MNTNMDKIDFVLPWVDGSDPAWTEEKEKYQHGSSKESRADNRYRDWGWLRYWFRAIEKNTPWLNKLFFVTCGHIPDWLNTDNPKLVCVDHKDYIPMEFLPTFNSSVIETFFHRIPNLEEKFVVFNDDFFVTDYLRPEFFFSNGLPVDALVFNAVSVQNGNSIIEHVILNDLEMLSKYYDKRNVNKKIKRKIWNIKYGKELVRSILLFKWRYYTGIQNQHVAMPYLKSMWTDLWNREEEEFLAMAKNRFRTKSDYNEWVFRYQQLLSGQFEPKSYKRTKYYELRDDNQNFVKQVLAGKYSMICINDTNLNIKYEKVKAEMTEMFDALFPEKSSFEKDNMF